MNDKKKQLALIVDDEPDIRELLELTLARMDIDTRSAADVAEARNLLGQASYDLCLTDMRLPDGSGIDLVRFAQQNHPGLPIAVITAHGSMDIAIVDNVQKLKIKRKKSDSDEEEEDEKEKTEDLESGAIGKTSDPVRMYLREMGSVDLLTREGEVEIAKRIERGQAVVRNAILDSPLALKELFLIGDKLEKDGKIRFLKEKVRAGDEGMVDSYYLEAKDANVALSAKATAKEVEELGKAAGGMMR